MKLKQLLDNCDVNLEVTGISQDSRKVEKGYVFVAVPGSQKDGLQFAEDAIARGAIAVVTEKDVDLKVPVVTVPSARRSLALMSARFYGNPADGLTLLAVTGTNGKTTTAYLLEAMCAAGGACTGLIGTVEYKFMGRTEEPTHTTPDAPALHGLLRRMVDAGVDTVILEASSHALDQERLYGLTFRAAAFTNLTRDHLDYHLEQENYFQAKRKLFSENLAVGGVAVVNGDDTFGSRIYNEVRAQKRMAWKFSRRGDAEISAANVEYSLAGMKGTLKTPAGDVPLKSQLIGAHNLENILAAAGVALGAGFSRRDVQDGIERTKSVRGRLEKVEHDGVIALVDYAHTDDALRRSLEAARALTKERVVVVFGCGGDRDKGKRPLMGAAAAEGADVIVLTSDNPRTESSEEIISQISAGIEKSGLRRMSQGKAKSGEKGYLVDEDRAAAIQLGVSLCKSGDVLLVAGKGHEAFQNIGNKKLPFDDREETLKALKARS